MMSERDEVLVMGRWRKRTDAVARVLSKREWSGKRGPPLELRSESRQGEAGPHVIVAVRGSARAEFYGFEDPAVALDKIRAALKR